MTKMVVVVLIVALFLSMIPNYNNIQIAEVTTFSDISWFMLQNMLKSTKIHSIDKILQSLPA